MANFNEEDPHLEYWYRYDDPIEGFDEPYLSHYMVKRHTPKGVVLNMWGDEKFVLNDAHKRYAYPTKALALNSYIKRKEREIGITAARHDRAVNNLALAKDFAEKEKGA